MHQELTTTPYSDPVKKAICKQSLHRGQAPEAPDIILGICLSGIENKVWVVFQRKAERRQKNEHEYS